MAVFVNPSLGHDGTQEQSLVGRVAVATAAELEVIAPIGTDHRYLKRWIERNSHRVCRPCAGRSITADNFVDDDLGGAVMATEHLIGLGPTDSNHRRQRQYPDEVATG